MLCRSRLTSNPATWSTLFRSPSWAVNLRAVAWSPLEPCATVRPPLTEEVRATASWAEDWFANCSLTRYPAIDPLATDQPPATVVPPAPEEIGRARVGKE